jgi:hypothetical protein
LRPTFRLSLPEPPDRITSLAPIQPREVDGGYTSFRVSLLSAACDLGGNVSYENTLGVIQIPLKWNDAERKAGYLGKGSSKTAIYVHFDST